MPDPRFLHHVTDTVLMGCYVVLLGKYFPTFRKFVVRLISKLWKLVCTY